MDRREFIQKALAGVVVGGFDPVRTLRAAIIKDSDIPTVSEPPYSPVRVAHIELESSPSSIEDLYFNHAGVARLIHDHVADSLSGADVPVIYLNMSGVNPDAEQLKQIQDLDVYSVSQGLNQLGAAGIGSNAGLYEQYWMQGDAIGVYSAGNQGDTNIVVPKQSMFDFSDTAVTVGEAGRNADGTWQVKDHSQKAGDISFLAPNITDEGFRVPIINQAPDLKGHDELVRDAEIWLDARAALEAEGYDKRPEQSLLGKKREELLADPDYVAKLDARVSGYLTGDPTPFHQKMIERVSRTYPMDENGLSANVDGTSFCSPYVAGALSAAKFESKMRDVQGKPSLSSEELVALSYLACDPVTHLEGGEDLKNQQNGRGIVSNNRAGFGVFTTEQFTAQVKEAYQRLDKNPNLASIPRTVSSSGFLPEKDGSGGFTINIPEGDDITILRTRFEYHSDKIPPYKIKLTSPQGHEQYLDMSQGSDLARTAAGDYHYSWGSTEQLFGEHSAGEWKVEPIFDAREGASQKWQINPTDLKLTIHGVEKGGLIDQMIDKKLGIEKEQSIEIEQNQSVPPPVKKDRGGRGF